MSASVSARRGGQPSTTQPMAGPCDSPQVVTRKRWPKLLWDIGQPGGGGSGRQRKGEQGRNRQKLQGQKRDDTGLQTDAAPIHSQAEQGAPYHPRLMLAQIERGKLPLEDLHIDTDDRH